MKFQVWLLLLCVLPIAVQAAPAPKTKSKSTVATAQEVEELRQAVAAQHLEIQQLRQELRQEHQEKEQAIQKAQEQAAAAEKKADTAAAEAGNREAFTALRTEVSELKAATDKTVLSLQEQHKRVSDLESPLAIHFKGITLTPGGFMEAAALYRSHNENGDVASTFANIPFSGTANSQLSEFRGTARQTRTWLLAEGKLKNMKMSGYLEMDFQGAAPTANEIQTTGFNFRQRQLWAQVEFNNGFSVLGGQSWSLLTTNRKGITPRQEYVPVTIDPQYTSGYNYARQWGVRFTKNFNNGVWAAFSVENPETVLSVTNPPPGVFGFNNSPNATSPGSLFTLNNTPGANGISTDLAPDLVGKVVFEPGWGHYEIKALGRFFRDRINGSNNYSPGGGLGLAALLPATKKLDILLETLGGTGIGRYGSGVGPDVTLRPNGTIVPVRTLQAMAGVEWHPTQQWDVYLYGGDEYYSRTAYVDASGAGVGYGSPLNNNSGCSVESPTSSQPCQAQNRTLWQTVPGFWYRPYKGPAGTVQFGMQYSYIYRNTWVGTGLQPKGIENIVMSSFRYYLP